MARPKETEHQISQRESEYMRHFLDKGSMTVRELIECLNPRPHVNTVATILKSLESKGFLRRIDNEKPARYYATDEAARFADVSLARVVRNFFNDSYRRVVSSLVEEEKISVDELKDIINMIENARKDK